LGIIRFDHVSFTYPGSEETVLSDISLNVHCGEYFSIVGNNGSGKSTFIKLALGLLSPTRGMVENNAKRTGYVPQRLENINMQFPITVKELLSSYRKAIGIRNAEEEKKLLSLVGMEKSSSSLVGSLSGGQCQRIFIARALIGNPDLLILDEPSTGIDAENREVIYEIIRAVKRERGVTVISVEHNLRAAAENSTLLYHIKDGRGHLCSADEFMSEFTAENRR
jgi:zinc transport system ATP-binding protein